MSILVVGALCFSSAAWAAGPIKPGLWEMTMKSDAMKNMPKIPPEQLKKMREMGITMPQMQDGGMVTKVCISQQLAEREQPPEMSQNQSGCQTKNYQRASSSYSMDIVCDGPNLKGEGKVKGAYSGNEKFSSTYDFKGTAHGHPVDQHHENSGKWLSADCGDLKPIDSFIQKK
jgi:hypothetical protein